MNISAGKFDSSIWEKANRNLLRYMGVGGEFTPFVPARAEGSWLYDASGRRVLDFTSGQMSSVLGHAHPELVDTMREAAASLDHLFSMMITKPVVDLAAKLAELVPGLPRSMFLSTGGESVEAAIRLAKVVTGKWEIVGFAQSYHGSTGAAAAATYSLGRRGHGPLMPGAFAIPAPNAFRPRFPGVTWEEELDDSFALLDRQSTGNLAAFIAEPILSTGGVLDLPLGYLAALQSHCERRGMLLIIDEAQTSLGRSGEMFAFERDNIVPDILLLSKTLGAGMAMSSVSTSDAIAEMANVRGFTFVTTHVNDPLPASVALKVLEIVQRDQLVERSKALGTRLRRGLQNLLQHHECIGDVRGRGLLLGMEFVPYAGHSAAAISQRVIELALEFGLSANITGAFTAGVMRFAPPLTSSDEEIDFGISVLDRAITQVVDSLGK
ncbi:aspartate aminotransferase family protein [Rhizobium leguminosarum]|uniref:aspartate aminotransferase family protein n=1 Tax=Rhizobium leguminosarum TaxID=384 RepID=UPI001031D27E|nr:aspartate aminotransferase family protein [Rhizobium leguminosarum]TBC86539.1 aspartate aminotransferase family protein [Rhizobium leguminosarum]